MTAANHGSPVPDVTSVDACEVPGWIRGLVSDARADALHGADDLLPSEAAAIWLVDALEKTETQRDMARNALAGERRSHDILVNLRRNQMAVNAALQKQCDAMRPVVAEAQRWYHGTGEDHSLGVEVPRYENLTGPSTDHGKANA